MRISERIAHLSSGFTTRRYGTFFAEFRAISRPRIIQFLILKTVFVPVDQDKQDRSQRFTQEFLQLYSAADLQHARRHNCAYRYILAIERRRRLWIGAGSLAARKMELYIICTRD
jgi:hypothetical protein